jgi:recombination protein RecR
MTEMMQHVKFCSVCLNYTESDPCPICQSNKRNKNIICVVEDPNDVLALERTNEYFGLYHVLHGILNPLDGIGPEDIKIRELLARLSEVDEVILAINPSVEGEVTMQYLSKMIKPLEIKVSRLASGLPMGGAIEYSDEATLSKALESRITI